MIFGAITEAVTKLALSATNRFAAACAGDGNVLDFPTWYEYLDTTTTKTFDPITNTKDVEVCTPQIDSAGDIFLVVLAVIDIALRIVGILAVVWVIWGGIQYATSQGEPDRTKAAKDTILNAVIGLVICLLSITLVSFIGGQFN